MPPCRSIGKPSIGISQMHKLHIIMIIDCFDFGWKGCAECIAWHLCFICTEHVCIKYQYSILIYDALDWYRSHWVIIKMKQRALHSLQITQINCCVCAQTNLLTVSALFILRSTLYFCVNNQEIRCISRRYTRWMGKTEWNKIQEFAGCHVLGVELPFISRWCNTSGNIHVNAIA